MALIQERLTTLLDPVIRRAGFELWELDIARSGGQTIVQVVIDHPGGVTLEHCREVSLLISETLDAADPLPSEYTLEVASPGIERSLRHARDLDRFEGSLAQILTSRPCDGATRHEGYLAGVDDGFVGLELASGSIREIPVDDIRKAKLLYDPSVSPPEDQGGDEESDDGV